MDNAPPPRPTLPPPGARVDRQRRPVRLGNQEEVCSAIAATYAHVLGRGAAALRPADLISDRKRPDYVASFDGAPPIAIEHTRFFLDGRQAQVEAFWAENIVPLLDPAREGLFVHGRVQLRTNHVPPAVVEDVRAWRDEALPCLTEGHFEFDLRSSGLRLSVDAWETSKTRLIIKPASAAWQRGDSVAWIAGAIREAEQKLDAEPGARRVLVLHSDDYVNLRPSLVHGLLAGAFDLAQVPDLDEVWLADTHEPRDGPVFVTCLWSRRDDAVGRLMTAVWNRVEGVTHTWPWAPGLPWDGCMGWRHKRVVRDPTTTQESKAARGAGQ